MANPFLNNDNRDVETAIMLEQAFQHDIGNAVAYTDGNRIFINTDDNLYKILPAYDNNMLKWLLWHERYHKELRHHNRFFKYLKELDEEKTIAEFQVTKEEVNIIMDILVHDSLMKLFPELVETAINNLAQLRYRNSLGYTFKSFVLEDMLKEYADFKHKNTEEEKGSGEGDGKDEDSEESKEKTKSTKAGKEEDSDDKSKEEDSKEDSKAEDGEGGSEESIPSGKDKDDEEPEIKDTPEPESEHEPEHDKTDWSKLDKIDSKEFIETDEGDYYEETIKLLRRKKFQLGKLTETLNGLATTTRRRSYSMPSSIHVGKGVLLKGRVPGKTNLFLCFDASGSMGNEMETFKEIISKSIPQAMSVPTTWFSGYPRDGWHSIGHLEDKDGRNSDYYKGQFKDFMQMSASNGYDDDGDRTIEMCWKAEQAGYSPIGVTDGGGQISWSKDKIKQLRRTILVGQREGWLKAVQKINPKIQIIHI